MLEAFAVSIVLTVGALLAQAPTPTGATPPRAQAPAAVPTAPAQPQDPQPHAAPSSSAPHANATVPAEHAEPPSQGEGPSTGRRGRRGQGQGPGQGSGPAPGQGGDAGANRPGNGAPGGRDGQGPGGDAEGEGDAAKPPTPPRRGIAVDDLLVQTHCARCHARDDKGLMTRISYLRKSPEGWSESIKRMIRLHGLQISPSEAKEIVRYLANNQGLTRSEAERSLYESERRVHWSEESQDKDFRSACSVCHTLGRVLAQARDAEEWQLLRATHVAMFPLARGQMGGGPPDDERRGMFGGGGPPSGASGGGGSSGSSGGQGGRGSSGGASGGGSGASGGAGGFGGSQGGTGDRVLSQLTQSQPLFTPEWDAWTINRREVPLAGTWTVTGHEVGRGDLLGTAEIARVDVDEYEVTWKFQFRNGDRVERKGRGLLYGGYSWRGSATDAAADGTSGKKWREVLLLDERWDSMRGRFFTGEYDEIGVDVTMSRHRGVPRVHAVESPWITVPAQGHVLTVFGENFPANVQAADFSLGKGITVTACERKADNQVQLTLDVAPDAECVAHEVAYGSEPGRVQVQLYDAVDYLRIRPLQGLARIGGGNFPKQFERFEAVAMHRGKDGKPYTDDDIDLWMVPAKWRLVEAPVREDDDDLSHVGAIDAATGVFTPAIEGPNRERKWSANNTGEVYVECTADLHVPERPAPPPKPEPAKPKNEAPQPDQPAPAQGGAEAAAPTGPPAAQPSGQTQPATTAPAQPPPPAPKADPQEPKPTSGQPKIVARSFRARANLIVAVPLYVRWAQLNWEDR